MRFSPLVERFTGDGADAWLTHYEAVQAQERGADVIILSVGDPDLQTPAPVVDRAIERLRAGDTHYLPARGRHEVRAAIAALHQRRCGQSVTADNVVFLSGAQNALFAASLCLAGPGDEVLTFDPLYATYPATLEVSGAHLVRVPAIDGFRPDLDALAALITPRTRALFWATPNNPSGVILSDAELAVIAELAVRHDLWLVSDEVYAGLAPGGRVPSLAAQLPKRVVTLGSLSKSHAMTGWRAGWLVGPEELTAHVESLAMCMLFGMPGFIQEAAVTALAMAEESQDHIRSFCRSRCARLARGLEGIAGLRPLLPQAGMFMLVDIRGTGLSAYRFMRALYEAERVSVMDGAAFGAATAGFIRICFAADEAVLDVACERIRRFCAQLGTSHRRHA
ncbi:MAG: pyridoxal phosphate-dependent aminotransferase [Sinobacteraceae bacterium]|nr:pyridoxal phosphate-dependent aminotransferase [Nevskiaceae bacterium]MBV9911678.1 pyridoxal phosphate-dependent aminotransferase [Nevskiaceae bacterium]